MYNVSIENGDVDFNETPSIFGNEEMYLEEDITNGTLTQFTNVRTKKEVNNIIRVVKDTAFNIIVFKLVEMENSITLNKQLKKNWNKSMSLDF